MNLTSEQTSQLKQLMLVTTVDKSDRGVYGKVSLPALHRTLVHSLALIQTPVLTLVLNRKRGVALTRAQTPR